MKLLFSLRSIGLLLVLVAPLTSAREFTILYTNDIESVYEPMEAFWLDDIEHVGGLANLTTLIKQTRAQAQTSFLLDAGDIFTGSLSRATSGKLVFDLYSAMGYDALNLGNHEFEYGWRILKSVMQRARFPVLGANIFYEGTEVPFGQQYTILERDGVRVGVIGVMGVDAFINTMMKANREGLYVKEPLAVVQPLVDLIRPDVDVVIVLTHQNKTAPMQTDKEADPSVQRGYDEDYELAGKLSGVDMIIGGHSDNGLWQPVRHPKTGTLIGMTFGQGMHLGYARFEVQTGKPLELLEGKLIRVDSDALQDDPVITALISSARAEHPELIEILGSLDSPAPRKYYRESPLGNLLADMLKDATGADVGLIAAGAIRADLQAGEVTVEAILNVFPFTDTVTVVPLSGQELKLVLEKSLTLEYGLAQFAGVTLTYDSHAPAGRRLIEALVAGEPIRPRETYTLVTGSFTATGGENYTMFTGKLLQHSDQLVSDVFVSRIRALGEVVVPSLGRQLDIREADR